MSGDYMPAVFGNVLSEFSKGREALVQALTRAAEIGDYDAVAEFWNGSLTGRALS